jgi:hypothetical protein
MITLVQQIDNRTMIHLIMGRESELTLDLAGSIVSPVTPILPDDVFTRGGDVCIMVTRCRSEHDTATALAASGVAYAPTQASAAKPVKPVRHACRCRLCGTGCTPSVKDVPVCDSCIRIEIGRHELQRSDADSRG